MIIEYYDYFTYLGRCGIPGVQLLGIYCLRRRGLWKSICWVYIYIYMAWHAHRH